MNWNKTKQIRFIQIQSDSFLSDFNISEFENFFQIDFELIRALAQTHISECFGIVRIGSEWISIRNFRLGIIYIDICVNDLSAQTFHKTRLVQNLVRIILC